jgi:hypothetical protein
MIRIVLKGSSKISEDEFAVFHETVELENEELEKKMERMFVVGAEIVKVKEDP